MKFRNTSGRVSLHTVGFDPGFIFVQFQSSFVTWTFAFYSLLKKCHWRSQISPFPWQILPVHESVHLSKLLLISVKDPLALRGLFDRLRALSQSQKGIFLLITPKLLELANVCSVHLNICDVSWNLPILGRESEKRWTFAFWTKKGVHKNKACIYHILWSELESSTTTSTVFDLWHWLWEKVFYCAALNPDSTGVKNRISRFFSSA